MKRRRVAFVAAVIVVVTGCSGSGSTEKTPVSPPEVDLSILEAGEVGDYVVFDSPAQLAAQRSVAVAGTVDGYSAGLSIVEMHADGTQNYRDETVVVRIGVDQVFKGEPTTVSGQQFVYVSLPRGTELIDQNGKRVDGGGPSTITPVADYERAIPTGTRVVVIASALITSAEKGVILNAHAGYPAAAVVLSGLHPQTFAVEDAAHAIVSGWETRTYGQIVKELVQAQG